MPKISVVLPCYNGSELLGDAIESCMKQTFRDWELIFVNDCSTDNSLEIAQRYAAQDSRIRIYSNEVNKKLPATLNVGFSHAQGEYLTWTSDDNIMLPEMLERMSSYLDFHPDIGMVVSDYFHLDRNKKVLKRTAIPDDINDRILINNFVGFSFMYRKDTLETIGQYREDLFLVEDYEYWIRMSFHYTFGIIHIPLYGVRHLPGSLTVSRQKDIQERLVRLRIEYLSQFEQKLKGNHRLLSLFYFRIVDKLSGHERIHYYFQFMLKEPFFFGMRYLFIHLPHNVIKKIKNAYKKRALTQHNKHSRLAH